MSFSRMAVQFNIQLNIPIFFFFKLSSIQSITLFHTVLPSQNNMKDKNEESRKAIPPSSLA